MSQTATAGVRSASQKLEQVPLQAVERLRSQRRRQAFSRLVAVMTLIEDWSMRGPSKFNDEALLFGGDAGGVAAGGLLVNPNHRGIRDREVLTDSRGQ